MARKVILFIAQSLDGYIARKNGSIDFLEFNATTNEVDHEYAKLMEHVDTVVMGRTTYDQVVNELSPASYPYEGQESYILTSQLQSQSIPHRHFVHEDIVHLVKWLKEEPGNDIWIIGGSSLIPALINADLIDIYQITTVPVILGSGISLFTGETKQRVLQLEAATKINNYAYLTYTRAEI